LARIVKPGHRIHGDRTRETRGAGYEYLHVAIDDHSRLAFTAIQLGFILGTQLVGN
jgi:hypothetical protein